MKSPLRLTTDDRSRGAVDGQEQVTKHFEGHAKRCSENFASDTGSSVLFNLRRQIVVELLAHEPARQIFDVAAGSGEITHAVALSKAPEQLIVNDISPAMLELARRQFAATPVSGATTWLNDDAFKVLEQSSFEAYDVIICLGLIAHTGRLPELLTRAHRCLRPSGVLILQSSLSNHLGVWIEALYARSPLRPTTYKINTFNLKQIVCAAKDAGYETDQIRRFGVGIPFGDRLLGPANFLLESKYAQRTKGHGAEAVFKLKKSKH